MRESRRWLWLIERAPLLDCALVQRLVDETDELVRIFAASLRTAQKPRQLIFSGTSGWKFLPVES